MDDLFGHVPQKGELKLAQGAEDDLPPHDNPYDNTGYVFPRVHTAESIREMFHYRLNEIRGASEVPWPPRMVQSHRAMAPYWAEWLKGGEGDRLLAEFRAELVRLGVDPINPLAQGRG